MAKQAFHKKTYIINMKTYDKMNDIIKDVVVLETAVLEGFVITVNPLLKINLSVNNKTIKLPHNIQNDLNNVIEKINEYLNIERVLLKKEFDDLNKEV